MGQSMSYERSGEWLKLPAETLASFAAPTQAVPVIEAGSHPHHVRQWLLALGLFPEKWLNRLFSVGGIQMEGSSILLRTFIAADPGSDAIFRMLSQGDADSSTSLHAGLLFYDDWCLVMDKPAGMPVHPSAPGQRGTLDEEAARTGLLRGDGLPAKHIHRLDDDTAGPVLYARNELAQLRLDEAMREKTIGRQYVALVQGVMKRSRGVINEPIGKDRHHNGRRRVSPGGEHAITHYETIEVFKRASLVRVWLETGRTHQIRVHMSHLGHPLVGDTLYGGSDSKLRHQALRGERLTFRHPWTNEETILSATEPDWFAEVRERYASL
ncbi:RluA family pseudouridine synthase [Paenibacillus sp. CF384]|uniref:RluA family pseudouridine synthase n=1 Tax=Paenibacillus sp. CF384 TaxID=1884382 RepID=UPI0008995A9F|nr:RluA family pseudouridine synthase [Paenibacillus sp. CF384]SDX40326.1 23S rRNA pseudouridine1911/1915/1917 synthase [Paenibacillus sp. CF384]